ncbi:MAG: alpha-hydroxy-acid oxidizing protein [Gemmatimonadetes bacterium]|nr:alpha-hydroxy-acid oxidizing protein [Gemmatimonadota bacterium]
MSEPVNLHEYEALARERLAPMVEAYYAGGADDEVTLREAPGAWQAMRLLPRMLVDVTALDLSVSVLGERLAFPVLTAPCALNRMAHADGESGVARAAHALGVAQVLSTMASESLEDVARATPGPKWFQLYCYKERALTVDLVRRAEAAGYRALCLTVDVPVLGRREREVRAGFHAPPGIQIANLERYGAQGNALPGSEGASGLASYVAARWDASLTWDSVTWLRSITKLPIVLKGVLAPDDAARAVAVGAHGVIVSTHGGRQLDTAISSAAALRAVVDAVGGKAEVYVDGGIRRGTDILKALALGARAVLVGRPYLWGLAVNGEAGVVRVLTLLREELALAMALSGRPTIASLGRDLIV